MAEKKFFVDINLQGSALTNAKIGTNSGIGSTEGAFGYDSASHRLQYFNGTATQNVANLSDISAVTGGLIFQGGYDPTTDTPDITDGTALKGYFWAATAAGTFLGESVQVGDSIVAKVDNAGATLADWLILQGNIVIATDSVDGISRLATQTEANDGTEAGAVVITPATLQGKIDAQITPEINSKVSKSGDTMSGNLDMGGNVITNVSTITTNDAELDHLYNKTGVPIQLHSEIDALNGNKITNLPTPTNGGDAANKDYVDDNTSNKLPLAGGTMSGNIVMDGTYDIIDADKIKSNEVWTDTLTGQYNSTILVNTQALDFNSSSSIINLPAPTNGGDAANKTYVDGVGATAESNANAYADSLAPNYDAAGAAATAESNANDYTDTAVDATRYSANIQTTDWTVFGGNPANGYIATITHNLGCYYPVIQLHDDNSGYAVEMATQYNSLNETNVFSNTIPSGLIIATLIKAAI